MLTVSVSINYATCQYRTDELPSIIKLPGVLVSSSTTYSLMKVLSAVILFAANLATCTGMYVSS